MSGKTFSQNMIRLMLKIQKLRNKYGFRTITDLYEDCNPIEFIYEGVKCEIIEFDSDDYVNVYSENNGYMDIEWDEIPRETLEEILEAFERTIIENDKFESVQYYSNI